ncbi:MAG TPA: trypsin-like peptidase domain-containing protein [Planctomycetota bacterium]|nr:trypsin-like peptidase domain-containing protein [Planctomycetota bacterium]
MRRIWALAALAGLAPLAFGQDGAYETLSKKVRAVVDKLEKAFVFFPGGSGSFISADGYCLTNHHVAGSRPEAMVWTADGKRYRAKRVATDSVGDVALFKVDQPETRFEFVELGDSDALEVGQYVISVGNPHGLANTPVEGKHIPSYALGIVSAIHRAQGTYSDAIQTDAAVNPGNSGGPLLTLDGKQVGINGRVAVRFGNRINSGVGYAISSNQIKRFLPVMMKGGHENSNAYHGRVDGLVLETTHTDGAGARVGRVTAGSDAEKAGFKSKDLIVKVDSMPVFSAARFQGVIGTYPADSEVACVARREGEGDVTLRVKLARAQAAQEPPRTSGYLGVQVEETPDGLKVTNVVAGSAAEKAGIQVDDLLLKIAGKEVKTVTAFQQELWKHKPAEKIAVTIRRNGEDHDYEAELGRRPGP